MYILILQQLFVESMLDIIYFPVWWYTGGLKYAASRVYGLFQLGNERLAPWVWLVNIFVPMYGQYDWQGRFISFVVRVIQIIVRGFLLLIWFSVCLALMIFWVVFPLIVTAGILKTLTKAGP